MEVYHEFVLYVWLNNILYMVGLTNWFYPRNAIVNDPLSIHDVGRRITELGSSVINQQLTTLQVGVNS